MLKQRFPFPGLLAVLLALAVQLGLGASVPQRNDPVLQIAEVAVLCHPAAPGQHAPAHPPACLICPLCLALHAPVPTLVSSADVPTRRSAWIELRDGLPPPARAPPPRFRPPAQPRAPPAFS